MALPSIFQSSLACFFLPSLSSSPGICPAEVGSSPHHKGLPLALRAAQTKLLGADDRRASGEMTGTSCTSVSGFCCSWYLQDRIAQHHSSGTNRCPKGTRFLPSHAFWSFLCKSPLTPTPVPWVSAVLFACAVLIKYKNIKRHNCKVSQAIPRSTWCLGT